MRPEVVEAAAAEGVKLIVSVDTGIRAAEVVRRANELGIDVIVTDHHLPETELPPALAVLNPNRPDCPYPEKNLCGAGVAFKLVQALLRVARLAAGEAAARFGIVPEAGGDRHGGGRGSADRREPHHRQARSARPATTCAILGLRALLDVAGFTDGAAPSAHQVAFQIAPRINAAGRMDTANAVIELFLTDDAARARELAKQLHDQNAERQQVEAEIRRNLRADRRGSGRMPRWSITPKTGIAACWASWPAAWWSACAGRCSCWAAIRTMGWRRARAAASRRSICWMRWNPCPNCSCASAATRTPPGVTLEAARVEEFRRRFNAYAAARLTPRTFCRRLEIDAVLESARDQRSRPSMEIFSLAPFGHGNPAPLFAALDVEVAGPPAVMKEKHLRSWCARTGAR